jgi:hypothetical protein
VDTTETSREAAAVVAPKAATLRAQVLNAIIAAGDRGLTDEEIQAQLGMPGNTQRPRRRELEQAYRIDTRGYRKNDRGRNCMVWIAA